MDVYNHSDEKSVRFLYSDSEDKTESVQFSVYLNNLNGTLIYQSSVYTDIANFGVTFFPLGVYENESLAVAIDIVHEEEGSLRVATLLNKNWKLSLGIEEYVSQDFLNWFFILLLSVIAIYASVKTNMVGLAITGLALLFVLFGWFTLSMSVLGLAIVISLLDGLANRGKK